MIIIDFGSGYSFALLFFFSVRCILYSVLTTRRWNAPPLPPSFAAQSFIWGPKFLLQ
ncbi:hypothetical protein BDV28DRAFT_143000 [Aspergillus coremiiformis]|uniref:Uncharacterized protein n=1 Tax=Aspergillus coremiiformis TaxID=138285 RepID=A0A5N6YTD9_9EURO|nr:hypothetical protein BDV28DRAFT_143000 [Aspergillus coremiiformis]